MMTREEEVPGLELGMFCVFKEQLQGQCGQTGEKEGKRGRIRCVFSNDSLEGD